MDSNVKALLKENKITVLYVSLLTIVRTLCIFLLPLYVNYLLKNIDKYNIFNLILLFLFFATFLLLFNIFLNYIKKKEKILFKTKLNNDFYYKLFKVKYDVLNKKGMSYYTEYINTAVSNISNFFNDLIPNTISVFLMLLISILIIGYYNIYLTIVLLLLIFLQYNIFKYINKRLSFKCQKLSQVCSSSFSYILSAIENLDFLKSKSNHKPLMKLLFPKIYEMHSVTEDVNNYAANLCNIYSIFVNFSQYFMFLYFGYLTLTNNLNISNFVFISIVLNLFFESLSDVSSLSLKTSEASASWKFINEEIIALAERENGLELKEVESFEFVNAKLGYEELTLADNINLSAKKGDVIFIKGETGSGKSSLVKCLLGFNEIESLKINNKDYKQFNLESIRNVVAYVSQNFSLINDSLLNNILMGEEADTKKVINFKFFKKFIKNNEISNLEIVNKGGNLSGGDKQKIILARTLLKTYDLLILDEVTSSMDKETEKIVFDEIFENRDNLITIIISHDDSLMKYANRVWLLKDKKFMEVSKQ